MRIVFLNPCADKKIDNDGGEICYGIAIVSACLKQAGHDTGIIQMVENCSEDRIAEILREKGEADIYAFHYLSHFRKTIEKWSKVVKAVTGAKIVCGGTSAVIEPQTMINIKGIDAVCVGEGENALVEYVRRLAAGTAAQGVENFWIRNNGSVIKGEVSQLVPDLNELPFYDMGLYDLNNIRPMKLRVPCLPIILSRGCPYNCTYCANNNIKKAYRGKGRYFRTMTPERAVNEVKNMLRFVDKPATISFVDDTINFDLTWLEEFCRLYKQEINLPFKAMGRGDHITPASAQIMKDAGCFRFIIGVEHGNYQIRRDLLHRHITDEQLQDAAAALKQAGIQVQSCNMCGLPGETREDMLSTIRLNARCGIDIPICAIFWPFRNTDLHNICIDMQLISESFDDSIEDFPTLAQGTILNFPPDMKNHIRFNSNAFAMLVHMYRGFLNFPGNTSKALTDWFEDMYISGKFATAGAVESMIKHGIDYENNLFRDLELPLLQGFELEYGLRFQAPEIASRRI
jgi:radical SAM superfamily enzyme YgiQ (UPF0313 family)